MSKEQAHQSRDVREKTNHPGWFMETKTAEESSSPCTKKDIIHECVVNYSWGLVGAF